MLEDGTAEINKYIGEDENLEVAEEAEGHIVTSIGKQAFRISLNLQSITLPETITSIGDYAFESCENLRVINFPRSIKEMGNNPFVRCADIQFVVPEKHSFLVESEGVLFSKNPEARLICCPNIKESYTIPKGAKSIGGYSFFGCEKLRSVTIPDSMTFIGPCAFDGCINLSSITLPDTVKEIEDNPFTNCPNIEIHVSDGNPTLEVKDRVLFDKNDKRLICFPDTEVSYGIPEGTKSIGTRAFYSCDSLINVTVPESVTEIGRYAFYGCDNLNTIILPDTVTDIKEKAFEECGALTVIAARDSYAARYCEENGVSCILTEGVKEETEYYDTDELVAACEEYTSSYHAALSYANSLYMRYRKGDVKDTSLEDIELLEAFIDAKAVFDALQTEQMTEEQIEYYEEASQSVDATEGGIIMKDIELTEVKK